MTKRIDDPFPELEALGLTKRIEKIVNGPILCKHSHCGKPIEWIYNTWFHVDGAKSCGPTYAAPYDDV